MAGPGSSLFFRKALHHSSLTTALQRTRGPPPLWRFSFAFHVPKPSLNRGRPRAAELGSLGRSTPHACSTLHYHLRADSPRRWRSGLRRHGPRCAAAGAVAQLREFSCLHLLRRSIVG